MGVIAGRVGWVSRYRSKGISRDRRWRAVGVNGEPLASGQGYSRAIDVTRGLKATTRVLASWFPEAAAEGLKMRRAARKKA